LPALRPRRLKPPPPRPATLTRSLVRPRVVYCIAFLSTGSPIQTPVRVDERRCFAKLRGRRVQQLLPLMWRSYLGAQYNVPDLCRSPTSAASCRDAACLKLCCDPFVRVNTRCANLCDRRRKQSSPRIGLRNNRPCGPRTRLTCELPFHQRQMSLNGSGLIAV
jgi:hypothetical protein